MFFNYLVAVFKVQNIPADFNVPDRDACTLERIQ